GLPTPAFDLLGFQLESPSQLVYNPSGDSAEIDGLYRRISVSSPEAGVWTMRIDKSQLSQYLRPQVDMGWLAAIDHPGYGASAWIDRSVWTLGEQVTIKGSVQRHDNGMGGVQVSARVSVAGGGWMVDMFDDGHHDDEGPDDSVYTGQFTPTAAASCADKRALDMCSGTR